MSAAVALPPPAAPFLPASPPATPPVPPPAPVVANCPVRIWPDVVIPPGIVDHASYRAWANSDDSPERGRFSFYRGTVWVDLEMEQLYSHNFVKGEFTAHLIVLAKALGLGRYVTDGMLVSCPSAGLSTVPDGLYVSYDALRSGRVARRTGSTGCTELEGPPEMVLEVVSPSSVQKDAVDLPPLYFAAGVLEFWLADARGPTPRFTLHVRGPEGFVPAAADADGFLRSDVFGRSFRLTARPDPLGDPLPTLESR